jgi:hypothetical protein
LDATGVGLFDCTGCKFGVVVTTAWVGFLVVFFFVVVAGRVVFVVELAATVDVAPYTAVVDVAMFANGSTAGRGIFVGSHSGRTTVIGFENACSLPLYATIRYEYAVRP